MDNPHAKFNSLLVEQNYRKVFIHFSKSRLFWTIIRFSLCISVSCKKRTLSISFNSPIVEELNGIVFGSIKKQAKRNVERLTCTVLLIIFQSKLLKNHQFPLGVKINLLHNRLLLQVV